MNSSSVSPAASLGLDTFTFETTAVLGGVPVPLRLGVETYGTLNAARTNAVLVCHYYTGTSHAAGRSAGDDAPGWWDALIGPGKAVDTERFFVVCMNTPSNVQAADARVVTTGPGTLHPDGTPWGARFPAWDFADLVAVQWALLRSFGALRWHAVIGPSLGGMQALQWAARKPELTPRVAAIVTSPYAGVVLREVFAPLLHDVARSGGILAALRLITLFGWGADGLHASFGRTGVDLASYLPARASHAVLAHVLDIARLVTTHDLRAVAPPAELARRWQEAQVRLLTVNVRGDQFFPCAEMRDFAQVTREAGARHTHLEIESEQGHLACVNETALFAPALRALLQDGEA
ncbi:alpha/beta fold hydrolase [Deinococcus peraridilitoris]|uniref:Homoserine acetyltransferase n=1 Tax=Deinococcus peraridilitoris (strain DSM 19664 / LMG 22246 / CIP 109416 / KR-200) TaxID=937777 RepID=L0A2V1_DEIPD|nr:alpha/beta fold hydrolase [Deinococcus peraridilitoris]AFZ67517.1 homoserine acetyltransferase [Deinococcus peraridilitoris DSM 19664]